MTRKKTLAKNQSLQWLPPYWILVLGGLLVLVVLVAVWFFFSRQKQSASLFLDPTDEEEIDERSYDVYEVEAEILEQDSTLYNDYFAFSYQAPKNWAVYEWWEANLAKTPGKTGKFSQLEIGGTIDWRVINFIALANERYSLREQHFDIMLDAVSIKEVDNASDFLVAYEQNLILGDKLSEDYQLEKQAEITLAGRPWQLRLYQSVGDKRPLYLLRLATPLKDNYFLVVESTYWLANPGAYEQILSHLQQSLKFS